MQESSDSSGKKEGPASPPSQDELHRYGAFRTAGFNKGGIRKLVSRVLGQTCNPNFAIVLGSIAKVFVSEMVEMAKEVQTQWDDTNELLPSHVHEAYRRMYHTLPNMKNRRGIE